jgi:hypothetical protein
MIPLEHRNDFHGVAFTKAERWIALNNPIVSPYGWGATPAPTPAQR